MGIGSIGSISSFWQQDQSYWSQQQNESQSLATSDSLISAMGNAMVTEAKGLASIANKTALNRVNSELTAAIQNVLSGGSNPSPASAPSGSSSSSNTGSSASSSSPATGTGSTPVTISTSLLTLGIPAGGTITISAGGNTTTYASTGADTVGDLMNAINADLVGNAGVTASLNRNGELVLTSKNDTNTITVGGVYASNIGFGVAHDTFQPTKSSSSSSSGSSTNSSGSGKSSSGSSTTSTTSELSNSTGAVQTLASENASSAASLLSDSGASGSLVNMLA